MESMDTVESFISRLGRCETRQEVAKVYDDWSKDGAYDRDVAPTQGRTMVKVVDAICRDFSGSRQEARVLDVAAGSGQIAEELLRKGFTRIDAVDPSAGMLKLARDKHLYKEYYCAYMEDTEGIIQDNSYDIVCLQGALSKCHLPVEGIRQMHRVTKPGGLICLAAGKRFWDSNPDLENLVALFRELEKRGQVHYLRNETIEDFADFASEGIIVILQKIK